MTDSLPLQPSTRQRGRARTLFGAAIGRETLIYGIGMAAIVPFGIVSLAITTRYIGPADYGRLAILFTFASGLTIICNVGSLHGALILVYGMAGDGEVDVVDEADLSARPPSEKRRIMGTSLLLTFAVVVLLCGVPAAFFPRLVSQILLHNSRYAQAAQWACISAAIGAYWRLVQQVFRFERRAVAYVVTQTLRPAIVVLLTIVALAQGWGVDGVLAATAAGTLIAVAISGFLARSTFVISPRLQDIRVILGTGWRYAFVTVGYFAQSNADVIVLSQSVSVRELGYYSVASKIAQLPTYASHGFLLAWPPLERSAIGRANKDLTGRPPFASTLFTYLMILTASLVVIVTLATNALVELAAPSYSHAARYIPFVAGALFAYVFFYGLYRACMFKNRIQWVGALSVASAAVYVFAAIPLVHAFSVYGITMASAIAWISGSAVIRVLDKRGDDPLPMQWRRLTLVTMTAVLAIVFETAVPGGHAIKLWLAVGTTLGFLAGLLVLQIVPIQQLSHFGTIVRLLIPGRSRSQLLQRVDQLPRLEHDAVVQLVGERRPIADFARSSAANPNIAVARMVRGMRRLEEIGRSTALDVKIGAYLLSPSATFERNDQIEHLYEEGVPLIELHEMEHLFSRLRAIPRRQWRAQQTTFPALP